MTGVCKSLVILNDFFCDVDVAEGSQLVAMIVYFLECSQNHRMALCMVNRDVISPGLPKECVPSFPLMLSSLRLLLMILCVAETKRWPPFWLLKR